MYALLIGLGLLIAAGLRFYQLPQVPEGLTWDEAAIGYNGYAIWHTRRDEWLERLPISFRSFGDYKAPLAIYLNAVSTFVFGLNVWAVRFPFAVAGVLAVLGIILLTEQLTHDRWLALLAGTILALSPWHLQFSRAGFEVGLALSLTIWGMYALIKYIHLLNSHNTRNRLVHLVAAVGLLTSSLYTYHSAKLVGPLLTLATFGFHWKKVKDKIWESLLAALLATGVLLPLLIDSIKGQGAERINSTVLVSLRGWNLVQTVVSHWLTHWSPQFLVLGETSTLRHGSGSWGVLLPTTLFLSICGLIALFSRKRQLSVLGLVWVAIGFIPAAIGENVPHANRALLALPGFILLAVSGFRWLRQTIKRMRVNNTIIGTHGEVNTVWKASLGVLIIAHCFMFFSYLHDYYSDFAAQSAEAYKAGYVEAFEAVVPYEDQVDKILFTSDYGQPYIYALFVRETNPIWYRGGSLIKYEFTDQISVADLERSNTIVVASNSDDMGSAEPDVKITTNFNQLRFAIYYPNTL